MLRVGESPVSTQAKNEFSTSDTPAAKLEHRQKYAEPGDAKNHQ